MPENLPELPELPDVSKTRQRKKIASSGGRAPSRCVRFFLNIIRVLTILALGLAALFLALLLVVQTNADRLTGYALDHLSRETSVRINFRDAGIDLVPLPGLRLSDVEVRPDEETFFTAKTVILAPNLFLLIKGSVEPEFIILEEPTLSGRLNISFDELLARLTDSGGSSADTDKGSLSIAEILPLHCRLRIRDGQFQLMDKNNAWLKVLGLETRLFCANAPMFNLDKLGGTISIHSLEARTHTFAARLLDFSFRGQLAPRNPLTSLQAALTARGAMTPMGFGCAASVNVNLADAAASWKLSGSFVYDGVTIPWGLHGSLEKNASAHDSPWAHVVPENQDRHRLLRLRFDSFILGDDRLRVDGLLNPDPANPAVFGRVDIGHVSLTRWLDFARELSPGLQVALDNITDGYIDFAIDTKGLSCPRMRASAGGAVFDGKGGVADWSQPVIYVDMLSDFVDLGKVIPEATGMTVKKPEFGHKCLTAITMADIFPTAAAKATPDNTGSGTAAPAGTSPAQGSGDKTRNESTARAGKKTAQRTQKGSIAPEEDSASFSYDIRLGARAIHYGYADLSNGHVIITPGVNSSGEQSARLTMKVDMYDGQCTGTAYFSGDKETEYEFAIDTKNVNLGKLRKDMPFIPSTAGTGQAQVRVRSKGSEIDRFLAQLQGTVKGSFSHVIMTKDKVFSPFDADLTLNLASASFKDNALGLNGRWDVNYRHDAGWDASGTLQGAIWFGGRSDRAGVRFDNVTTDMKAKRIERLASFLKGKDVPLSFKGTAFCDTSRFQVGVRDVKLETSGLGCQGRVTVREKGNTVVIEGSLSSAQVSTPLLTRAITGSTPSVPAIFSNLAFTNTELTASVDAVHLEKFSTRVDGIPVSGSIVAKNFSAKPAFDFALSLGDVDLDRYLPAQTRTQTEKKKDRNKDEQTFTAGDTKSGNTIKSAPRQPVRAGTWDFSFVKNYAARGTIKTNELHVRKVHIRNLSLPVSLNEGRLTLQNARGTAYGGHLTASATVNFSKGIQYNTTIQVRQFELGLMLRDRGTRGIFHCRPDFKAELNSSMTGPGQFTSNLNGRLSFTTGRGSYQPSDENYNPTGKIMYFDQGRMTASITSGVMHMNEFSLRGSELHLTGSGDFNLHSETMDAEFTADLPGLPTVPLRLHGSFSEPRTSIGGMVIINAIGSVFKGIFSLVGDVFDGILGFFQ